MAFDHGAIVLAGRERLRGKLSYSNAGFALAPRTSRFAELREIYTAALGHEVSATNLKRVLERRAVIEPTGDRRPSVRRRASCRGLPLPRHAPRDHRPLRGAPAETLSAPRPSAGRPLQDPSCQSTIDWPTSTGSRWFAAGSIALVSALAIGATEDVSAGTAAERAE